MHLNQESPNTEKSKARLKRKLFGSYLTKYVRTVVRTRVYFNPKTFKKALIEGEEPDFPLERVLIEAGDMYEVDKGYVLHVFDCNQIFADVLVKFYDLKIAWQYQTGSRYFRFKTVDGFHRDSNYRDPNYWITMKRKFREIKKEQERTKRLRVQGKIGREYFEEW